MKCKKCHKEIEDLKVCPYCKCKQISKKIMTEADSTSKIIEDQIERIPVFNNISIISFIMIGLLFLHILINWYMSDSAVLSFIFGNLLSFWLFVYFILLQFDKGKKYFRYLNMITGLVLGIKLIKVVLNIFVVIDVINLLSILSYLLLTIFFIKSFFKKETKDIESINILNSRLYLYSIGLSFLITFVFIGLQYINDINIIVSMTNILKLLIVVLFSRYIFLYDTKKNLFKDIEKLSKGTNNNIVSNCLDKLFAKYNFYQLAGFIIFGCGIVLGIVNGSENAICSSGQYTQCLDKSFNIPYMIITFGISFFIAALLYWMGDVKAILVSISKNELKKVKKSVKNIDKV